MSRAGWVVAVGAGVAGAVVGGAGVYAARAVSGPQRPPLAFGFSPFEVGVPAEDVALETADGIALSGWWLEQPGSARVVIVCHGHRGSKEDLLGIGPGLWRAGNSVLLFDFRGNGGSGDGPQSLAHHEQADLDAAIDWVRRRRPDARVAVVGFSMGAAVTILVAARRPDIEAIVLDSPFATMRDVVAAAFRSMRVPTWPIMPATDWATGALYGYRFAQVRPLDVIGQIAPRPLLLLHGTADQVIPFSHALDLYAAAGMPKELVVFEGADHCGGYFEDRPGYISRVASWLDAALPAGGGPTDV